MAGLSTWDVNGCCCPYGEGCLACSPCQIPKKDLTATVSGTSGTLVYFPSGTYCGLSIAGPVWAGKVGPFPIGGGVNVFLQFACIGGVYQLAAQLGSAAPSINCGGCAGDPAGGIVFKDFTCNPFHLHWQIPGCAGGIYSSLLDVYIDDPGPATPCPCNGQIFVQGCGTAGLPGAAVTIKDGGGTTVASGTTDSSGNWNSGIGGSGYTVIIARSRFNTKTLADQTISCGINTYGMSDSVADGYHCIDGCAIPLPDVLHWSDSRPASGTATWNGSSWNRTDFPLVMILDPSVNGFAYCGGGLLETFTCPPSFEAVFSFPLADGGPFCPFGMTGTITE